MNFLDKIEENKIPYWFKEYMKILLACMKQRKLVDYSTIEEIKDWIKESNNINK